MSPLDLNNVPPLLDRRYGRLIDMGQAFIHAVHSYHLKELGRWFNKPARLQTLVDAQVKDLVYSNAGSRPTFFRLATDSQ